MKYHKLETTNDAVCIVAISRSKRCRLVYSELGDHHKKLVGEYIPRNKYRCWLTLSKSHTIITEEEYLLELI